jgi:NhaA family Na+:H+ antiporter
MPQQRTVLEPPEQHEGSVVLAALRQETVGGLLLLVAAAVAVVWASSRWSASYVHLQHIEVGPPVLHLHLTLEEWAGDGLLALFFFLAGLELKRELVVGGLRKPSAAALPIAAAVAGMVVPAALYLVVTAGDGSATHGWAVPTSTDIAFALAVLAVAGRGLPTSLRAFLLTSAIVDDMGAILVIAVVYTAHLSWLALGAGVVFCAAYAAAQRARWRSRWVYIPLALATWVAFQASGVHATVAGVALGLLTRVRPDPGEEFSPAERLDHRLRPLSAGVAVPVFALLSAGVPLTLAALHESLHDAAAIGVIVGLVVGKFVGVLGGSAGVARATRAELSPDIAWGDMAGLASITGIGFTVSLLIAELAFPHDPARQEHVKTAVLLASALAALLGGTQLLWRGRRRPATPAAGPVSG